MHMIKAGRTLIRVEHVSAIRAVERRDGKIDVLVYLHGQPWSVATFPVGKTKAFKLKAMEAAEAYRDGLARRMGAMVHLDDGTVHLHQSSIC